MSTNATTTRHVSQADVGVDFIHQMGFGKDIKHPSSIFATKQVVRRHAHIYVEKDINHRFVNMPSLLWNMAIASSRGCQHPSEEKGQNHAWNSFLILDYPQQHFPSQVSHCKLHLYSRFIYRTHLSQRRRVW